MRELTCGCVQNNDKLWEWSRCLIQNDKAHVYQVEGEIAEAKSLYNNSYNNSYINNYNSNSMLGPVGGPSDGAEAESGSRYMHLKVYMRREKVDSYWSSSSLECFGTPLLISIPATGCSRERLRAKITEHMRRFLKAPGTCNASNMELDQADAPAQRACAHDEQVRQDAFKM